MQVVLIVYVSILLFISVLIVGSILLQEDKSGGGGMSFLGGSSQSFFGASSGSILSKFTSILLVIYLVSGIVIAIIASRFTSESFVTKEDISKTEFTEYSATTTKVDTRTDIVEPDDKDDSNK